MQTNCKYELDVDIYLYLSVCIYQLPDRPPLRRRQWTVLVNERRKHMQSSYVQVYKHIGTYL